MKMSFAAVACAATLIILLSACGSDDSSTTTSELSTTTSVAADDGPTTLAKGEDVELVGKDGLAGQTLNIDAEQTNGKVTGEFRVTDNVITIKCADTDTDGVLVLGGEATAGPDVAVGDLQALIIREGDPDSVALVANDNNVGSCTKLLESIPENLDGGNFVDVEDGYDIKTG